MSNKLKIKYQISKISNSQLPITNSSGMALVIVVAIIAVLSSIGITFMYTMRMEEKTAFNYMQGLKASYIAKSGIEHAITVLKSDGRDTGFVAYKTDKWGYRNQSPNSIFSAEDDINDSSIDNDDDTITVSDDSWGSGMDSRWLYVADDNGDTVGRYAVLIIDESSKININTAGYQVVGSDNWDNSPNDPRQGWKPFEISLEKFFYAGSPTQLDYWDLGGVTTQDLASRIVNYRYGSEDGQLVLPLEEPGKDGEDDNADSIILEHDDIDNNADGQFDEEGEGLDDPYEFVAWDQYDNDQPFITIEEIKNIFDVGPTIFDNLKPYITVYSSDENTTDSGFLRLNINLLKDATTLYSVMYSAWEDLMALYPNDYSYEELKRLAAQCAVNTIDYADTDNVSTFLEISHEDTGLSTNANSNILEDNSDPWDADEWIGAKITVVFDDSGTKVKQVRTIYDNDENTVWIIRSWDAGSNPPNGSYYHIQDNAVACGVEAIRINEIMVKPAYQWEAEELFEQRLGGGTGWHDTDLYYKGIYSETASTLTDPKTITVDMEILREGFYRLRALTYSSAPDTGIVALGSTPTNLETSSGENWEIDQWESALVTIYYNPTGTGVGQERRVVSNTTDTLNIDPSEPWTDVPANGDLFSVAQDHSFTITLRSDAPDDIVKEAGTRNIGGWLLEDLGIIEVKDAGLGEIELKTSENTNEHNGAYLDYIQLSQQPDCEYVELLNISDNDVDIGGWVLATSAGWTGTIPDGTIIEARDYMVLAVDKDDSLSLDFDQDDDDVPIKAQDNIFVENTWFDGNNSDRVVQLQLSTAPINIAEDGYGDTIILSGSIFTDSPIEIPAGKEESGEYIVIGENTLQIGSSPWLNNQWKGATIAAIIEVDNVDSTITRQVVSNTPDTITISTKWEWESSAVVDESSSNRSYYIFFKPMAVTLYKGLLADQQIVSQVNYLAEDINRVCYTQDNGVKVYGFVALEKDDPTVVWDRNNDGIDDWWHINIEGDEVLTISGEPVRGGTPGGENSVCMENPALAVNANVPNMPFATVGDIKDVSRMRIEDYGWASDGGDDTLKIPSSLWTSGDWEGAYILIASGKGAGQIREIKSNTSNEITVTQDWTTNPNDTSEYIIFFEWSRIGYDELAYEDTKLVQRIADKITVSQKRLEAEKAYPDVVNWDYEPNPVDIFLTPFYFNTDDDEPDTWWWGIRDRIQPENANGIYDLYIKGMIENDSGLVEVIVTTSVDDVIITDSKLLEFTPDRTAYFGQIQIGGKITNDPLADTDLLAICVEKRAGSNIAYFDAIILSPEYRTYGRININTADTVILQALPGITTSTIANDIINHRENDIDPLKGPFKTIGEILNVEDAGGSKVINLETFSKISNLITTKSKVFTIISTGQALRESDKGDVVYDGKTYEILGEKKYMVVMER